MENNTFTLQRLSASASARSASLDHHGTLSSQRQADVRLPHPAGSQLEGARTPLERAFMASLTELRSTTSRVSAFGTGSGREYSISELVHAATGAMEGGMRAQATAGAAHVVDAGSPAPSQVLFGTTVTGAALLASSGRVYIGASCPLGTPPSHVHMGHLSSSSTVWENALAQPAEQVALASALSAGETSFLCLVLVSSSSCSSDPGWALPSGSSTAILASFGTFPVYTIRASDGRMLVASSQPGTTASAAAPVRDPAIAQSQQQTERKLSFATHSSEGSVQALRPTVGTSGLVTPALRAGAPGLPPRAPVHVDSTTTSHSVTFAVPDTSRGGPAAQATHSLLSSTGKQFPIAGLTFRTGIHGERIPVDPTTLGPHSLGSVGASGRSRRPSSSGLHSCAVAWHAVGFVQHVSRNNYHHNPRLSDGDGEKEDKAGGRPVRTTSSASPGRKTSISQREAYARASRDSRRSASKSPLKSGRGTPGGPLSASELAGASSATDSAPRPGAIQGHEPHWMSCFSAYGPGQLVLQIPVSAVETMDEEQLHRGITFVDIVPVLEQSLLLDPFVPVYSGPGPTRVVQHLSAQQQPAASHHQDDTGSSSSSTTQGRFLRGVPREMLRRLHPQQTLRLIHVFYEACEHAKGKREGILQRANDVAASAYWPYPPAAAEATDGQRQGSSALKSLPSRDLQHLLSVLHSCRADVPTVLACLTRLGYGPGLQAPGMDTKNTAQHPCYAAVRRFFLQAAECARGQEAIGVHDVDLSGLTIGLPAFLTLVIDLCALYSRQHALACDAAVQRAVQVAAALRVAEMRVVEEGQMEQLQTLVTTGRRATGQRILSGQSDEAIVQGQQAALQELGVRPVPILVSDYVKGYAASADSPAGRGVLCISPFPGDGLLSLARLWQLPLCAEGQGDIGEYGAEGLVKLSDLPAEVLNRSLTGPLAASLPLPLDQGTSTASTGGGRLSRHGLLQRAQHADIEASTLAACGMLSLGSVPVRDGHSVSVAFHMVDGWLGCPASDPWYLRHPVLTAAQERAWVPLVNELLDPGLLDYDIYARQVLCSPPSVFPCAVSVVEEGCLNVRRVKEARAHMEAEVLARDAAGREQQQATGATAVTAPASSLLSSTVATAVSHQPAEPSTHASPEGTAVIPVGTLVFARFKKGRKAYPGVVSAVYSVSGAAHPANPPAQALGAQSAVAAVHTYYDIKYEDGDVDKRLPARYVRRRADSAAGLSAQQPVKESIGPCGTASDNAQRALTVAAPTLISPTAAVPDKSTPTPVGTALQSHAGVLVPSKAVSTDKVWSVGEVVRIAPLESTDTSQLELSWRECKITAARCSSAAMSDADAAGLGAAWQYDVRYTGRGGVREYNVAAHRLRSLPTPPSAPALPATHVTEAAIIGGDSTPVATTAVCTPGPQPTQAVAATASRIPGELLLEEDKRPDVAATSSITAQEEGPSQPALTGQPTTKEAVPAHAPVSVRHVAGSTSDSKEEADVSPTVVSGAAVTLEPLQARASSNVLVPTGPAGQSQKKQEEGPQSASARSERKEEEEDEQWGGAEAHGKENRPAPHSAGPSPHNPAMPVATPAAFLSSDTTSIHVGTGRAALGQGLDRGGAAIDVRTAQGPMPVEEDIDEPDYF